MKPATLLFPRPEGDSAFNRGGVLTAGESLSAEELAVAWKGWTNGGGERVSTAAQFLRLGDKAPSVHTPFFTGPGFPAARTHGATTVPATPTTRAFPEEPKALLAPIGSALERLVANGRDQLSLTVRFEQGGSLSLKLALRDGQVSTQIQTDVPGLEGAIKSAWGQLAQDWQGRGTKLADPQFVGGGATSQHDKPAMDGRNAGRNSDSGDAGNAFFARGRSTTGARDGAAAAAESTSTSSTGAADSQRRGLLTWA